MNANIHAVNRKGLNIATHDMAFIDRSHIKFIYFFSKKQQKFRKSVLYRVKRTKIGCLLLKSVNIGIYSCHPFTLMKIVRK